MMRNGTVLALLAVLALSTSTTSAARSKSPRSVEADPTRMEESTFTGLEMRGIGPALMSGRIADIAIDPRDQSVWYVAVGSGNLWKTSNAGTTWTSLFEDQASYSLGCVTLDPSNPDTVWLGTGENVGGRHVGYGDGVYRSRDGGETWARVGLERSEHIGKILVDPRDSDVVFVAAQGPLWSSDGERGLYRSKNGGETWERILAGGPYTGVNDVILDPRDPDVLYATTHQRLRTVAALINGGPESGIHKSTDGGTTWRELKRGLPEEEMGRIGLALAPQNPDVLYATIELPHRKGGFFRSDDGGESWEKRSDYAAGGTGPHYYQEIFASPHEFDRVYHMDVRAHVSENGGKTFVPVGEKHKHVDNHALAFDPDDPDYLLAGCDGGLYESWDQGREWKFVANLPLTQFYKVAVDYEEPFYNVYGGTQDNNTQGGPSRTDNVHGIRNADWFVTLFGDGHQPAVDPTNANIVYSQWQQGNLVRHDRKTGEVVYIQPQPREGEPSDRFNWDAPILISPHESKTLFHASQRVWRSDDRGDSWRPISGDLTRGLDRLRLPMMGRIWSYDSLWDLYAMSKFGTVTSLAQSPLEPDLIYAGTDDGVIQVTENGGAGWRRIDRLPGVPDAFFVNDIKADLHDADTVFVAVDQHKIGDFSPYLLKSTDRGRTWKSIASDLPARHLVWRLVQDHVQPRLLFVGTEFGVFFSVDGGDRWVKLAGGAPNIPFRDLAIQTRENDLVGATFGRGFFILDDYTPLREVSDELLAGKAALFPVRKAWWYVERRTLGGREKASQGGAYFTAPNPPFGAVFTYYLGETLRTRKEQRLEEEKELQEANADTPAPTWDELQLEKLEEDTSIVLTVRDSSGEVVRVLTGPVSRGFHRVAWDLRRPSTASWSPDEKERDENARRRNLGFLAAPGTYSVSLARRLDGKLTDLGQPREFEVVPLHDGTLQGSSPSETAAFLEELGDLQRSVRGARSALDETAVRVDGILAALLRSDADDASLGERARELSRQVAELRLTLSGNPDRARMNDPGPVSIVRRLEVAVTGSRHSTYGPTATHRESVDIARRRFAALRQELDRLVAVDLPDLQARLDDAGVPWTPGRGVPAPR